MRLVEGEARQAELQRLTGRGATDLAPVEEAVAATVASVLREGDSALVRYAREFDGLAPDQELRVSPQEMQAAAGAVSAEFRSALEQAASHIRQYCEWQKPKSWIRRAAPGLRVGQLVCPLDAVGCYVPGGRHPLPSTLLMTVIPAQVAGVERIVVVSPRPAPETLAAADLLGVKEFYRVGGAQAIAALAYGTATIPRVHKIVGPGNLYVTAAKKRVSFDCAIDFLAGPTEVVLVSHQGNPAFLASDLVAQAEHDPDAAAILITSSRSLAQAVTEEVRRQSAENPTARESLEKNGVILLATDREEAMRFANAIAAEHLTVERADLDKVRSAGSVFVGNYSPQAMGDYASGPNHTLPTAGMARYRGGLSVLDYVKIVSIQESTRAGLQALAPTITTLAEAEGLSAHAESVRIRCAPYPVQPTAGRSKARGGDA